MKPFSLEEYLANPSRKVITRGGSAVKIHCTNYHDEKPIIAEIEGSGQSISYNKDGSYFSDGESVRDLFFAPEKRGGWVNVHKSKNNRRWLGGIWNSKQAAEDDGKYDDDLITTIKIEWEE